LFGSERARQNQFAPAIQVIGAVAFQIVQIEEYQNTTRMGKQAHVTVARAATGMAL
jgi:hypothetical protein